MAGNIERLATSRVARCAHFFPSARSFAPPPSRWPSAAQIPSWASRRRVAHSHPKRGRRHLNAQPHAHCPTAPLTPAFAARGPALRAGCRPPWVRRRAGSIGRSRARMPTQRSHRTPGPRARTSMDPRCPWGRRLWGPGGPTALARPHQLGDRSGRPSAAWPSDPWRNPAWGSVGVRCYASFPAQPKWPAHPPSCNPRWGSPACRRSAQTPPLSRAAWRGPPAPFGTWRGGRRAVAFGMPAACAPAGRCPQPTRAAATPAGSGTGLAAAVVELSQHRPLKGCVRHTTPGWVDLPTAPPRKCTRHGPPPWRGSDGRCKPPSAFVSRLALAAWLTPAPARKKTYICICIYIYTYVRYPNIRPEWHPKWKDPLLNHGF